MINELLFSCSWIPGITGVFAITSGLPSLFRKNSQGFVLFLINEIGQVHSFPYSTLWKEKKHWTSLAIMPLLTNSNPKREFYAQHSGGVMKH